MTRRRPRINVADFVASLDSGPEPEELVTATSINEQTASRMAFFTQQVRERLSARFVGGTADAHRLSVRSATKAIASLQESVSIIGAGIMGHNSARGNLPESVIRATELHLSPMPSKGSIVFELHKVENDALVEAPTDTLLDESFAKLFEVISSASESAHTLHGAPEAMRSIGPRAARQVFLLCNVLVSEGMGIDLQWADSSGNTEKTRLSKSAAVYLKTVASNSTERVTTRTVSGILQTTSLDTRKDLEIQSDDFGVVKVSASSETRAEMGRFYNKKVVAMITTTETVNIISGAVTENNRLDSVELEV